MADFCVIGAGPAGSTFAARMAQLGHDVCLIERARFPRSHLGESLSPGVLPLLEATGARDAVEAAGFRRVRGILVKWESALQVREDPHELGLIVDRGAFDQLLLERARALAVRVLQPAHIRERKRDSDGWRLTIEVDGQSIDVSADFLADAGGRAAATVGRRQSTDCRTLALYAYWRGPELPTQPRIEAGRDAWYWGVPLPDGTYNTLVFVDAKQFRSAPAGSLSARFVELLYRSSLMADCAAAELIGPVRAIDATPYLDGDCVSPTSIKLGEAALALDPISSSGVQRAIQTALAGAIVANTLLRKPELSYAALRFYRANLTDASTRHRRWSADIYRMVALQNDHKFWVDRASRMDATAPAPEARQLDAQELSTLRVALSRRLEFVEATCIDGDFVAVKSALRHPGLVDPVAYLEGRELAPLLRHLPAGFTPLQIAQSWSSRMPLRTGLAIAGWLVKYGILVGSNDRGASAC